MQKLAVIQSVYKNDKAEYLQLSLNSILNQTFCEFTFFLGIDGEIGDDLKKIIEEIKDDRLIVIANNKNEGLASMLNRLLKICHEIGYEYIARMDSDDIAILGRFERQISFLDSHVDVDAVGGAINEIDDEGRDRGKLTRYPCSVEACRAFFAKRNPVAHPAVMFRRRYFEKAGWCYPTDFVRNEDTRLWHEGYKHGCKIANLPDVVLNFRMTNDMFMQRRNGIDFAKSQLQLRKIIIKDLEYGSLAYVYAYAMFFLMISPRWVKKIAYRIFR